MELHGDSATLAGQDIICFANDWDSDPLSKKHIMVRLARQNRVLWVNSIGTRNPRASARDFRRAAKKLRQFAGGCKRAGENLFLFSPLAVPFHGNRLAQLVNQRWLSWNLRQVCRRLGFRNPLTWTFLPSTADVAGTLGEQFLVYHCVDEFSEFTGTDKAGLLEMERRLIGKADLVVVSSAPLYENKREMNPNTFLVTHGVEIEHFRKACDPNKMVPREIAALPQPVIGFYGLVADWIDLDLIRFLALARPRWSFVLIGTVETDTRAVKDLANVQLLGRRDYAALPAYCKGFSVAIVPFRINELALAANPLKMREYLAAGLPVVSTALPEARRLGNLVRIGENYPDFLGQIDALLAEGKIGPQPAISQAMEAESWDHKVAELSLLVRRRNALRTKEGAKAGLGTAIPETSLASQ